MLNNLKSQSFLLHPKGKFFIQAKNFIKISGVCTTPDGYIPDQVFVKIGKREINCENREGNQFWFQFKVGTGLKLIKVYSQHKDKKRILSWYIYFIKSKEILYKDDGIDFSSYMNWLKLYQFYNIENKILQNNKQNEISVSIITFVQDNDSKYLDNFVFWIENQPFTNFELLFCSNKKIKSKQFKKYKLFQTINSSKVITLSEAIQEATGEIILFLAPNIKLHNHSLPLISDAFKNPKIHLCYGDEDIIGEDHFRRSPNFRTSFDSIRIINDNYIGNYIAYRKESVPEIESKFQCENIDFFHQLILHLTHNNDECVEHIPYILFSSYIDMQEKEGIQDVRNEFILTKNSFDIIESEKNILDQNYQFLVFL